MSEDAKGLTDEAVRLLRDVYGALWIEAYYDPYNDYMREWAKPLADKMQRLNELYGFKP